MEARASETYSYTAEARAASDEGQKRGSEDSFPNDHRFEEAREEDIILRGTIVVEEEDHEPIATAPHAKRHSPAISEGHDSDAFHTATRTAGEISTLIPRPPQEAATMDNTVFQGSLHGRDNSVIEFINLQRGDQRK